MNIATSITISRFVITLIILLFFFQNSYDCYKFAFILLVLAVITDVADGFVARRMNQETELGAKLDPLVDKIMIHSIAISLFYMGVYNPFIVFAMFFRDMIVDGLRNIISEVSHPFASNFWGKAKFSLQSASVGCGVLYCMDSSIKELAVLANVFLAIGLFVSLPGVLAVWVGLFGKRSSAFRSGATAL